MKVVRLRLIIHHADLVRASIYDANMIERLQLTGTQKQEMQKVIADSRNVKLLNIGGTMAQILIQTAHFEPRADLKNKIVSLLFRDKEGNEADIWLGQGDLFVVLEGIYKMLEANPQMQSWKKTPQARST